MKKLNLVIISGSHRKGAESSKVVHYIEKEISEKKELGSNFEVKNIFLADENLSFFSDARSEEETKDFEMKWKPISKTLDEADACIIVSPEWNGMVPSQLKNLFLLIGKELAYKPTLLITVSAGMGGSYPINELRTSSYKNSKIHYLPEHVIIRHAEDFNKNPNDEKFIEVKERIENNLHILLLYANRLKDIHKEILARPLTQKYPYGM